MKQSTFIQALKFASHAMAKKDIRYYLNGVLFEFDNSIGTLTMVATDGHRMAVVIMPCNGIDNPLGTNGRFIIAADSVGQLLATFKAASTGHITITRSSDYKLADTLVMLGGSNQVFANIVDGKFPDWRRVSKSGLYETKAVAVERIAFNGDYLAAAGKACGALGAGKYAGAELTFFGSAESMRVRATGVLPDGITEAYAIVMPVRV